MGAKYDKLMQSFLEYIFADVEDSVIRVETSDDRVTMAIEHMTEKQKSANKALEETRKVNPARTCPASC